MCHHFPDRNMQKHLFSRWRMEVSVLDPEQTVQCCSNFIIRAGFSFVFQPLELVQNAEDAEAKEMGILFDNRNNNQWADDRGFNKHFKGPALCFYNDAVFTEKDWEGICMIESSVKEDDPLTVGRFGLGFKSVFHLTDFPCILSGETLMFINPHEENSLRVFATNSLREWQRNSLLDSSCIVSALDDIFGFSQNTLIDGYYNGTLFWFPLRRRHADLSRSVYQKKTVDELLMSFMKDAVNILLFLSHLEKIEVFRREGDDRRAPLKLFSICIGGNVHQYRQENNTFTREIRRTGKGIASDSVHFNSEIIIHTEVLENDFTYKRDFQKWLIVKLLKCSGVSKTFQSLIQDEDMPYCPCVGVASPLESDKKDFKGHVFCTLPLPLPGMQGTESLTNLPVHVNGIFALNQNRSQLEWTTWDQPITNSYTQWNEHMLIEALPEAYHLLLSTLISISIQNRNDDKSVEAVYKCIPEINGVGIWTNLTKMFLQRIVHDKIIFTKDDGGKWIRPEKATIASFESFTVDREIEKTVKETLQIYGVNFAEVPNHVLTLLKHHRLANDITPNSLCKILCSNHAIYQSLPKDQKINLLQFLLYDAKQYSVQGLELLPLANGMFAQFTSYGPPVYMATAQEIGIFTHFWDQLVHTEGLPLHLCKMLQKGFYQVRAIDNSTTIRFLKESVKARFGMASSVEWLSSVWKYVIPKLRLCDIKEIPLVPVETWIGLELHKLTDFLIMKECFGNSLPDGMCRALESMGVTIIHALPTWLKYHKIQDYLYSSSAESVVRLLENIPPNDALCLNTMCRNEDRKAFAAFIGKCESFGPTSRNVRHTLKQLKIFDRKAKSCDRSTLVAIEACSEMLEKEDFPVKYPRPFLVSTSNAERNLARMLGATIVNRTNLILDTLKVMMADDSTNKYSASDTVKFMKHLLWLINKIESNSSIMNAMKCVEFVECSGRLKTASAVFDPTEHMALEFFCGESVFPDDKELTREPYLSGLLKLGMRRLENLQARDLLRTAECLDKMSQSRRCDNFAVSKSKAFQNVAEKYPYLLSPPIRSKKCIFPRISRINGYPEEIPWFGSMAWLCTPSDITSSAFASLVGSVQAVVDTESASKLSEHFAWNKSPAVSQVMCNFQIVIKAFKRENKPQLLSLIDSAYTYMSKQHHFDVILQVLEEIYADAVEDINIILCGEQFVCPRKVYFTDNGIGISLQPYLYKLSDEFQHFTTLFSQLGCHECVTSELLLDILERIKDKYDTVEDNTPRDVRNDLRIVIGIINWFRDTMDENELKPMSIPVPIYTGNPNHLCLKPARDCTYCESAVLEELSYDGSDSRIMYVHPDIAEQTARKLGVMTTERRRLKDNSMAISFGQKETLVTRLKGLLKGYPCDTGIMKELIQNADDAKATEINFIKDYRTHRTEKVWDEMYCPLQGPALCVFNNSAFTQEDLKGIQDLGIGSKAEDPTKTGQYGVGFNAVYNLTDAPSFLTKSPDIAGKETLCFFDPMCKYIPDIDENCPGKRIIDLHRFRGDFPDMMSGYLENELFQNKEAGTLFRLPLRMTESRLNHHFKTLYELDDLLKEFEKEVLEMLLFVKHVTKITISNISSGQLVEEYTVDVTLSVESQKKRERLFQQLEIFSSAFERKRSSVLDLPHTRDSYEMKITDSKGESRSWCVVQQIGLQANIPIETEVVDAYRNGDIGLLPQGGIAVLLSQCSKTSQTDGRSGKAFCFLPLPIDTGLPVEVHGHFSLDHETRRTLWEDKGSYRTKWNQLILKGIVAPAYVTALKLCLQHIFPFENSTIEQRAAKTDLRKFENYFPLLGNANGNYWIWLAQCVYQFIHDNEGRLFPIFRRILKEPSETESDTHDTKVSISWTALKAEDFRYPAYFLPENIPKEVVDTLQRLGMRLVKTSKNIQESMQLSEREAITLNKTSVVSFLRSHNDAYEDKCHTGGINRPVEETRFQDIESVKAVSKYCFSTSGNKDTECFDGIPLLITNDGYLHELTVSQSVFSTPFCGLLQSKGHLFVSRYIESTFPAYLFEQGLCQEFLVEDFLELFPQSEEHNMFGKEHVTKWNPDGVQIPNGYWLKMFWTFIRCTTQGKTENLKKYLKALGKLSFVPSTAACLHPVSELYTLVRKYTFTTDRRLREAVEKLQLPELNKDYLPEDLEFHKMLNTYVASAFEPTLLLRSFAFHTNKLNSTEFSSEESDAVLHFFANNLSVLRKQCGTPWIQHTLKSLRLYKTQQNTLASIAPDQAVIVIPGALPKQGIELWAARERKILLREDDRLEELYTFLEFSLTEPLEFYIKYVQSLSRELSETDFLEHLYSLKDVLLTKSYGRDYSDRQKNLIYVLANTPFIRSGRTFKKVSELKSPLIHVFQLMCTEEDFPPSTFILKDWHEFLTLIGLQTKITDAQYLEFARAIAREGRVSRITDVLQEKSIALTKSLTYETKATLSVNTLCELSEINFILPSKVDHCYSDIFRQPHDSSILICYSGSVPFEDGKAFWTAVHLLPKSALKTYRDNEWFCRYLNILQTPTEEQVILHCQNVGTSLKEKIGTMAIGTEPLNWIMSLMRTIYNALMNIDRQLLRECLFQTPLVFLPDDLDILPAYMIILNCTTAREIPPYLRKMPFDFGRYHSLFQSLGASEEPSLCQYMHVLHTVKQLSGDHELTPPEYEVVRSAISNILLELENNENRTGGNLPSCLYLPDSESKLKDAKSLVVSDRSFIQRRIEDGTSIPYFLGLEKLHLKKGKVELLKKLEAPYRPLFLSEITDQKVNTERIERFRSELSNTLETFLHSAGFVAGILRLLKAFSRVTVNDEEVVQFVEAFRNIKVWQAMRLRTYITLRRGEEWEPIDHSEDVDRKCYISKDPDGTTSIYFVAQEQGESFRWDYLANDLTIMIEEILKFKLDYRFISIVIACIGIEEQIDNRLNHMGIAEYRPSTSVDDSFFPKPGTYVPVKFHSFLDNARPIFDKREYRFVAMEIFDPLTDEDPVADGENDNESSLEATFIYVTIIEREDRNDESLPVFQRYRVNVGEADYVTVPAYKLYRFVRRGNTTRDMAVFERIDQGTDELETTRESPGSESLPSYSDACKEVRDCLTRSWETPERRNIIKFLRLRWHPDKNPGQETLCNKVFVYLQQCIARLEKGQPLLEETDGAGNISKGQSSFFSRMDERYNSYRDTFRDAHFPSASDHRERAREPQPSPSEARTWRRQADADLKDAKISLRNYHHVSEQHHIPAANWICYRCHQAVEKALKAVWFFKDANELHRRDIRLSHRLEQIAFGLGQNLQHLASRMTGITGEHIRMRYPDACGHGRIPADEYTRHQAEECCQIAEDVLKQVPK